MEVFVIVTKALILSMATIAWASTILAKDVQKKTVGALAAIFWVLLFIAVTISV